MAVATLFASAVPWTLDRMFPAESAHAVVNQRIEVYHHMQNTWVLPAQPTTPSAQCPSATARLDEQRALDQSTARMRPAAPRPGVDGHQHR